MSTYNRFTESCLAYLAWQWRAMGIGVGGRGNDARGAVDPEACLPLTWSVGRASPRLFDAALSWCISHGDRIDVTRLKTMFKKVDRETATVGLAWSKVVAPHRRPWERLLRLAPGTAPDPQPLFLDEDGRPMAQFGPTAPAFERFGWLRGPFAVLEGSISPPTASGVNIRFLMRSLFGTGARSEVLAALVLRERANTASLARISGYNQRAIQLVLSDLHEAGVVRWDRRRGRVNEISLNRTVWRTFLESVTLDAAGGPRGLEEVAWWDTPDVVPGLVRTWHVLRRCHTEDLTPHARATLTVDAIHHLTATAELLLQRRLPESTTGRESEQDLRERVGTLSELVFGELN